MPIKLKGKSPSKQSPVMVRKPAINPKAVPKKTFHPAEADRQEDKFDSKQVNIRLPVNVLDYYKDNFSPGYQTKIKEILTDYMNDNPR